MKFIWTHPDERWAGALATDPKNVLAIVEPSPLKGFWRMQAALVDGDVNNQFVSADEAKAAAEFEFCAWISRNTLGLRVPNDNGSTGATMIETERLRQIHEEGWSAEEDDGYLNDELLFAAICYAEEPLMERMKNLIPVKWPWMSGWWKPSENQIRNLVKAGALIAAEIDRRLRAQEQGERRPS